MAANVISKNMVFWGVPRYFRAQCREASYGGSFGYSYAGFGLAAGIDYHTPYDAEKDEWYEEIEKLFTILETGDDDAALRWLDDHFPRCMALVPARRRNQFLKGVYKAHEEEGLFC